LKIVKVVGCLYLHENVVPIKIKIKN